MATHNRIGIESVGAGAGLRLGTVWGFGEYELYFL